MNDKERCVPGYIPNKTLFSRFFGAQSDKETEFNFKKWLLWQLGIERN